MLVGEQETMLAELMSADVARLVVAFSGGADSVALLHWIKNLQINKTIIALHINHGLQEEAPQWQKFCELFCSQINVELKCIPVDVEMKGSIEENSRRARYAAFADFLQAADLLLLAHHADDQIETVLLNLFRGSEAFGVRGMPTGRVLGSARLYRPLLATLRADILSYCSQHKLSWIEDETNQDIRMDRNFLRHELLPRINDRFPGAGKAMRRAHERDTLATQLIERLAQSDLLTALGHNDGISLKVMAELGEQRMVNMLREFLRGRQIPLPSGSLLRQCFDTMLNSANDARPLLSWDDVEFRRHGDYMYLLHSLPLVDLSTVLELRCDPLVNVLDGSMSAVRVKGRGVLIDEDKKLELRFRQGGEKIQQNRLRTLKNLFQENGVPSWLRYRVPLIFEDDQLIAVPGIADWRVSPIEAQDRQAGRHEQGWVFEFKIPDRVR